MSKHKKVIDRQSTIQIKLPPKEKTETITLTLTVTLTDAPPSVIKRIKAELDGTARGLANDYDDWVMKISIAKNTGGEK